MIANYQHDDVLAKKVAKSFKAIAFRISATSCLLVVISLALGTLLFLHKQPRPVYCSDSVIELGEIDEGSVRNIKVTISNKGDKELVISDISSNCACSGLEIEGEHGTIRPRTMSIAPHTSINPILRVSINGRPGTVFRNGVQFKTNDPDKESATIEVIVSRITGGLVANPSSVIFDKVVSGDSADNIVEVFDSSLTRRRISHIDVNNGSALTVSLLPTRTGDDEAKDSDRNMLIARLKVSIKATCPMVIDEHIRVYLEGSNKLPFTIKVLGRIIDKVQLYPPVIFIPRYSEGVADYSAKCLCKSMIGSFDTVVLKNIPKGIEASCNSNVNSTECFIAIKCGDDLVKNDGLSKFTIQVLSRISGIDHEFSIPIVIRRRQ
ncbi:MAG: DUF1573 domain-containing protein [Gemmatales bacterium]